MKYLFLKIKVNFVFDMMFMISVSLMYYATFIRDDKDLSWIIGFIFLTLFISLCHSKYEFDNEISNIYNQLNFYENIKKGKRGFDINASKFIEIYNKITKNEYKNKFLNSFADKNPFETWTFMPVIYYLFNIPVFLLVLILICYNTYVVIKLIRNYKETKDTLIKIEDILKKMEDFHNLNPSK